MRLKFHSNLLYDSRSEINKENGGTSRRASLPLPRVLLKTIVEVKNQSLIAIVVSEISWHVEDGRRLKNNQFTRNFF